MTKTNIHETSDGRIVVNKLRPMSEAPMNRIGILIYIKNFGEFARAYRITPSDDYSIASLITIKHGDILGWIPAPDYAEGG